MKLSQKLIIIFLASSLIPLIGAGVLSYTMTHGTVTGQIHNQLENTANHQSQRVNEVMQHSKNQLGLFVYKLQIRQLVNELNRTNRTDTRQQLVSLLKNALNEDTTFTQINIVSLSGDIVASTDNSVVRRHFADHAVFLEGKERATSPIFFRDKTTGELRQYIAAPLTLSNQKIGVVVIETRIDDLLLITGDYTELGRTGETYLIRTKTDGTLQYSTPLRFKPDAVLTRANDMANSVDYRSQRVIWVKRPLTSNPDFSLIAKIDQAEVYGPLDRQRNLSLALLGTTVLLMCVSTWYFSRLITRPIKRLTDMAVAVRNGDLTRRVAIRSRDEIGMLGITFNEMTSRLAASYQALEQKVIERTRALDQKVAELETAKAKDDAILDSVGEGLIVTDNTGSILLINEIAANLLGIDRATAVNTNLATYQLYDDTDSVIPPERHPFAMTLATGSKVVQDIRVIHQDTKRSLNITASPVSQQGRTIGVIQIVRDITREKEVDRMKTEFISIASHQLRTPLSAIKWFTEMLLSGDAGKLKKDQQEYAQNVADSTERMVDLVSSLLNISRIESGRIIVDPEPTNLKELVTGIINDLKGKTEGKKQNLIVSVHKDLPKINLDPHLIGQVYLNLLTNAIKYTPAGGDISVLISRKGDEVISQVNDTGYGIPKSEQNKLFSKFFRASNIIKVESDGTGLGMYLVKSIVESSGGKIWFESEENKGTTFWFTLPMSGMKAKAGEVTLETKA